MTLFTDNPFEKMMIQKPDERRDNAPPVSYPPACASRYRRKKKPSRNAEKKCGETSFCVVK